jgi:hypothetical protein
MVRTIIVDVWMQHPGRAFLRCSARGSSCGNARQLACTVGSWNYSGLSLS